MALTPHEYYLLMDAHEEREKYEKNIAGTICAAVANFGGRKLKEAFVARDFFGGDPPPKKRRKPFTKKQLYEISERSRLAMLALGQRVGMVTVTQTP